MTCKAPPHVSEAWGGAQVPEGPPGSPGDAALLLQEPWLRTLEGHSTVSALSAAVSGVTPPPAALRSERAVPGLQSGRGECYSASTRCSLQLKPRTCLSVRHSVASDSLRLRGRWPAKAPLFVEVLQGKNTGMGCHSLLQEIFPTEGLNPGLLHCSWVLYHLSHQGSPQYT